MDAGYDGELTVKGELNVGCWVDRGPLTNTVNSGGRGIKGHIEGEEGKNGLMLQ